VLHFARYVCISLSAILLVAAIVAFAGLLDLIEDATGNLAAASTAFAFIAFAISRTQSGKTWNGHLETRR
jgi:hypothetical protein